MDKIKLENIVFCEWASEETNCFNADIYYDGVKIGHAKNNGRGESTYCYPSSMEVKHLFNEASLYCESLPPIKYEEMYNYPAFEVKCDMEIVVDMLLEKWINKLYN